MKRCGELCDGKFPVLMALARKTCIGEVTGRPVEERLVGTLTADILSVMRGAEMIRVHDVKEACDSLKILAAFQ
jgi:dihydropteroate synthase